MKTELEQLSEAYAGINEDKAANLAFTYCKYDISDAFEAGYRAAQDKTATNKDL